MAWSMDRSGSLQKSQVVRDFTNRFEFFILKLLANPIGKRSPSSDQSWRFLMKKVSIFLILALAAGLGSCKKPGVPSAEWTMKIATAMCSKTTECAAELMKGMPAGLPGGMQAPTVPSTEECVQSAMDGFAQANVKEELSAEEVEAAKACSESIASADCMGVAGAMTAPACQKFQEMASKKE